MIKSLIDLKKGEKGKITSIKGGESKLLRLAELGVNPGEEILVSQKSMGPIIIKVKDTNIALGEGLAENIYVEVVDHGEDQN
ncbi:MAG TPA: FeoA family protein [Dictyoglomaceae bacterium]|nr:FeoA family protein [Dictyoglomaceae bacterium]HOL39494.1 FeoA family protein [Dictyoglomaceae bacterium]HPP15365.1 FeoA family protein [Dictyoglomaceae bacterium]HPU44027.1 FeoA family protein [Dictyoglomaceae bacterium]